MAKDMKRNLSEERKHIVKTGGGPPHKGLDGIDARLLSIIGEDSPTIIGINGGADSLNSSSSTPSRTATRPSSASPPATVTSAHGFRAAAAPPFTATQPSSSSFMGASTSSVPSSPSPPLTRPARICLDQPSSAKKRKGDSYHEYIDAEVKKLNAEREMMVAKKQKLAEEASLIKLQKEFLLLQMQKFKSDLEERKQFKTELIDLSGCTFGDA
ncbi:uncharacterized protein [Diadema setosum]|uniref:uncharacterized protein n=1 Tax=Diadema setosum TaxID=31175 RepID=UPI003B3B4B8F